MSIATDNTVFNSDYNALSDSVTDTVSLEPYSNTNACSITDANTVFDTC